MRTELGARELYGMFLESEFWEGMARACKEKAGRKCERCGRGGELHAHHRVYSEHWFDVKLEDLECLCVRCHAKAHGKSVRKMRKRKKHLKLKVDVKWVRLKQKLSAALKTIGRVHGMNIHPRRHWQNRGSTSN